MITRSGYHLCGADASFQRRGGTHKRRIGGAILRAQNGDDQMRREYERIGWQMHDTGNRCMVEALGAGVCSVYLCKMGWFGEWERGKAIVRAT